MKAVCNAGPLMALGKLGQLGILQRLFTEVRIPHQVYLEVVINGKQLGAIEAQAVDFLVQKGSILVIDVETPIDSDLLSVGIDIGEVETIILGQNTEADWVLIDDKQARHVARREGLPLKGTLGVLLDAWRKNMLSLQELELIIREIKSLPELWISERLCDAVLYQARQEDGKRRLP